MGTKRENGKKILVAMDNSTFAQKALREAIRFSKCGLGSLTVLCVAPSMGGLDEMPPIVRDKLFEEAQEVVERARETLKDHGLEADAHVAQGVSPADAIVDYAQEYGFDLVVLGNKGKSNLERFIMGSVAEQVASHAPCSVWIVK